MLPHEDGLLCVLSARRGKGKAVPPRALCLAFADGHELWSRRRRFRLCGRRSGPRQARGQHHQRHPADGGSANADDGELTASGMDVSAFRGAIFTGIQRAMARGSLNVEMATDQEEPEKDQPSQNYTVRFRSLENGADPAA